MTVASPVTGWFIEVCAQARHLGKVPRLFCFYPLNSRSGRRLGPSFEHGHYRAKKSAKCEGDQDFSGPGRKDEDEAPALYQRGEAGNAKGHHKKADHLPASQFHIRRARPGGADEQGETDDETQAERGQPEARAGIKVADEHHQVPDEVTPEDEPARGKVSQISNQHGRESSGFFQFWWQKLSRAQRSLYETPSALR